MKLPYLIAGLLSVGAQATEPSPRPAPKDLVARPAEIDDVLVNPGIGFTTFQRFNGDRLNPERTWPEGYVDGAFAPDQDAERRYPRTSLAYLRLFWDSIEPERGQYRWEILDRAFKQAEARQQALILRVMPFGDRDKKEPDVPTWYRQLTHESADWRFDGDKRWRTDARRAEYLEHFGRLIQELGRRYGENPRLQAVDVAIAGPWGEGSGTELLPLPTRKRFFELYFEGFSSKHLLAQPWDWPNAQERAGWSAPPVGVRFDCLGDLGGFSPTWSHMFDLYPQILITSGLKDAWQERPVALEACWIMDEWKKKKWSLDYIIEQSLKWHVSSFNAKSSAVPKEWKPKVDQWLNKMGYRLLLRKLTVPATLEAGGSLSYASWWENKGVAPPYFDYAVAFRLRSTARSWILPTATALRKWLPGDSLHDGSIELPKDLPEGEYTLSLAIIDPATQAPAIRLAIVGRGQDGWYPMGSVRVTRAKP